MNGSEFDKRAAHKLLRFCVNNMDDPTTFFIDAKGLFLQVDGVDERSVPISKFPISLERCRHYITEMELGGLIKSPNGEGWSDSDANMFEVTDAGRAFISEFGWWSKQVEALRDNVVSIVVAVVISVTCAWAVDLLGPAGQLENQAAELESEADK